MEPCGCPPQLPPTYDLAMGMAQHLLSLCMYVTHPQLEAHAHAGCTTGSKYTHTPTHCVTSENTRRSSRHLWSHMFLQHAHPMKHAELHTRRHNAETQHPPRDVPPSQIPSRGVTGVCPAHPEHRELPRGQGQTAAQKQSPQEAPRTLCIA